MSFFSENYRRLQLPVAAKAKENGVEDNRDEEAKAKDRGWRNAQLGAIHSICAHYTLFNSPALVVLPTGAGKTAVLIATALLQRAKRVLVLSSTRMVREQIVKDFSSLDVLKKINAIDEGECPKVFEVKKNILSEDNWVNLEQYDVVISIPSRLVKNAKQFKPDYELFDLILIDEAHHYAAKTWGSVMELFPEAKKVLFTATPFRRDKKYIDSKIVYNYPLSRAVEDKIFGKVEFVAVEASDADKDIVIAKEAAKILLQDRNGEHRYNHSIMVRTSSKEHAIKLEDIYKTTELNLKRIDSSTPNKIVNKTIDDLKAGRLDGIICVNMLGEGFDFPNLKIAAVHVPHKSLAATLQFIGRFARTNSSDIGTAKFIATTSDIEIGNQKLFKEDAVWADLVVQISENAVCKEQADKKIFDEIELVSAISENEVAPKYSLKPFCHVKIFDVENFNLDSEPNFADIGQELTNHFISREENFALFITKEVRVPKWIKSDQILNIKYNFYAIFYDQTTKLMFINSTIKTEEIYGYLADIFTGNEYDAISKSEIHNVLSGLSDVDFFNLGLQSKVANGESYRILTGPSTQRSLKKSDGRMFANGHMFASAKDGSKSVTLGYSSASKVWSNNYLNIAELISWCKVTAAKVKSSSVVNTKSEFDNLSRSSKKKAFASKAYAASWATQVYLYNVNILVKSDSYATKIFPLADFDLIIDDSTLGSSNVFFTATNDEIELKVEYDLKKGYSFVNDTVDTYLVEVKDKFVPLLRYLNNNPIVFYLADFSYMIGNEQVDVSVTPSVAYDSGLITFLDWNSLGTDIQVEFYDEDNPRIIKKSSNGNKDSIHESLQGDLLSKGLDVLMYDHGSGEIADFVCIKVEASRINISLYHVKGSGGSKPGDRSGDVYEVCGQSVKCLSWIDTARGLKIALNRRGKVSTKYLAPSTNGKSNKFLVGDLDLALSIIDSGLPLFFDIVLVQPGIPKDKLSPKIGNILASADDYISSNGNNAKMIILASENSS
jgi:superfamily II DNA or RNA helicase